LPRLPGNALIYEFGTCALEDHQDAIEKGHIVTKDRDANKRNFPLLTISTGIREMPSSGRHVCSPELFGEIIAEVKRDARKDNNKPCMARLNVSADDSEMAGTRGQKSAPHPT
jgi:hypothetical protein